jgi:hypothetical protein
MKNNFPIFRKYNHDKTFFKINSKENFTELNIIGSFYIYRNQQALQYPEFVLIIDMIENHNNNWLSITEEEYEEKLAFCKENLKEKIT